MDDDEEKTCDRCDVPCERAAGRIEVIEDVPDIDSETHDEIRLCGPCLSFVLAALNGRACFSVGIETSARPASPFPAVEDDVVETWVDEDGAWNVERQH